MPVHCTDIVSRPKSIEHEFRYMTNLLNLYNLLNTINSKIKIKLQNKNTLTSLLQNLNTTNGKLISTITKHELQIKDN